MILFSIVIFSQKKELFNKNWIKDFLLKISYKEIGFILLKEDLDLKYKEIINDFLVNKNIFTIQMIPIPSISKIKINNKYNYFDNYELITINSYNAFSYIFDNNNNIKEFKISILDHNYIFIKYNNFSGEIKNVNGKERYYIYSKVYLEKIKNNLIKYGLINGLSLYNINLDKNIKEWVILDKKKGDSIGILINISSLSLSTIIVEDKDKIKNKEEYFKGGSEYNEKQNQFSPKTILRNLTNSKNENYNINQIIPQKNLNNYNYFNFEKNHFLFLENKNYNEEDSIEKISNNDNNINKNISRISTKQQNNKNFSNLKINYNQIYIKKNNINNYLELFKKSEEKSKLHYKSNTPANFEKKNNYFNTFSEKGKYIYKPKIINKNYNQHRDEEEHENYRISTNSKGLIGLLNNGSNSYINSIIQCLSNTPRLREELLNKNTYKELYKERKKDKKLSFALAEIFKILWTNKLIKYYDPQNLRKIIKEIYPISKSFTTNNYKDLILFFLETIHKELNQKYKGKYMSNSNHLEFFSVLNNFTNYYQNNNKSIISEEFYGYYNSMLNCCSCNAITHDIKILKILYFPIEEVRKYVQSSFNFVTLENCFEYYESPKKLIDNNKTFCNYCKNYSQTFTQNKIIITPKTLIIILSRDKKYEDNIAIQFNEYFNLKKYIFNNEKSPYNYELIGIICYIKSNDIKGHLVSYCKNNFDNKWYKYNGTEVSKTSFHEINKTGMPFVFFYNNKK